jgi:hypothetical protein
MSGPDEQAPMFLFRGSRTYLHSSTIFDYLLTRDPKPVDIDFAVHKMTDRQCTVSTEPQAAGDDMLVATYRSARLTYYLHETEQQIQGSYLCIENEICEHTTFEGATASLVMPPIEGATFIESVVGVYKKLLQVLHPDLTGKLVFARMTVTHVPNDGHCQVQQRRKIGANYFESRLFHEDTPLGKLIFGLL